MKNKEKYAKEILEIACLGHVFGMNNGKICDCSTISCHECDFQHSNIFKDCIKSRRAWAESEYVEPRYETDWTKVPVDTPVYLKGTSDDKRYFYKMLSDGRLALYREGRTSWSSDLAYWSGRDLFIRQITCRTCQRRRQTQIQKAGGVMDEAADMTFLGAAVYAIDNEIKHHRGKDEEHHKIIYAGLLRSRAVLEGLKINNLQIVNMSYEDFCRQVGDKTEVIFMTEEEVEEMREALRLYRKIKKAVMK